MPSVTASTWSDAGHAGTIPCSEPRQQPSLIRTERRKLAWGLAIFVTVFALPLGWSRFDRSLYEAPALTRWYAQEHFLLCLIPAFFIAGAIAAFISQDAVIRYLGPTARKPVAYGMASVSGSMLAVCSCTVLPLFAGIWRKGAGLGPATTFLYSGPAINVLAIVLTAAVLGPGLGAAGDRRSRLRRRDRARNAPDLPQGADGESRSAGAAPDAREPRPLWQNALHFAAMVGILVFANWSRPETHDGWWHAIWSCKWIITSLFGVALAVVLVMWFEVPWRRMLFVVIATAIAWSLSVLWLVPAFGERLPGHDRGLPWAAMIPFAAATIGLTIVLSTGRRSEGSREWIDQTWTFARQITPLLLCGVLIAGFLLGRPGEEGLIPGEWIASLVGGNSVRANLFASVVGAFMYFATLTEVPILQGLIGNGMGKGPALALLLAGPALSLPNMIVIRSFMGTRKTLVFVSLVVAAATVSGLIYGAFF